jgi:hypothetical protein
MEETTLNEKPTNKEIKDFNQKWQDHKEKYIKDNTLESMVYENGSAIALLYKELQILNTNLKSVLNGNQENS